jgi:hypothetical protein
VCFFLLYFFWQKEIEEFAAAEKSVAVFECENKKTNVVISIFATMDFALDLDGQRPLVDLRHVNWPCLHINQQYRFRVMSGQRD